jgi:hypothetical protein
MSSPHAVRKGVLTTYKRVRSQRNNVVHADEILEKEKKQPPLDAASRVGIVGSSHVHKEPLLIF